MGVRNCKLLFGAAGETRTLTLLLAGDFESPVSTISPPRLCRCYLRVTLNKFFVKEMFNNLI